MLSIRRKRGSSRGTDLDLEPMLTPKGACSGVRMESISQRAQRDATWPNRFPPPAAVRRARRPDKSKTVAPIRLARMERKIGQLTRPRGPPFPADLSPRPAPIRLVRMERKIGKLTRVCLHLSLAHQSDSPSAQGGWGLLGVEAQFATFSFRRR